MAPAEPPDPARLVTPLGDVGSGDLLLAGGKAAQLGELVRAGFPVPAGTVVTTAAYRAFVDANGLQQRIVDLVPLLPDADELVYGAAADQIAALFRDGDLPSSVAAALDDAYLSLGAGPVAVRSSATAEDLEGASFAGQQDTYLNVSGPAAVRDAVRRCWASLWTARAMAYRAQQGIDPREVSLAVVVQVLVDASAAGVMFTADPTTGDRDTVLLTAAWGLGEAVVGGLVDTDQLTLVGEELTVADRRVADKAVETVTSETGTTEVEVEADRRRAAVLDDRTARSLAETGRRIEAHFQTPQDIEWARGRDGELWILQARPITALPEPAGPVPTDWPVPDAHASYFRASIVEQLPDPLSPLFAELIGPAVTDSLTTLMNEFLGPGTIGPSDVGLPTVNGYAYYRYSTSGMLRLLRRSPAALRAAFGGAGAQQRWETIARPRYQAAVDAWAGRDLTRVPATELLSGVRDLVGQAAAYYSTVQTIIPLAASAEIMLTAYYDSFIRRDGDPPAATFLLGFDSEPIRAERSLWDLAHLAGEQPELRSWLVATRADAVVAALPLIERPGSAGTADLPPVAGAAELVSRLRHHLDGYGHTVYNLDFVNPVPADDPAPLVDTVRLYLTGRSGDPYARQRRLQQQRDAAILVVRRRVDPVRRGTFDALLRRAQAIAPIREDALADVGLAWPQVRRMLGELGRRMVAAGSVTEVEDVFWCRRTEIELALTGADLTRGADDLTGTGDLKALVAERRWLWRGQRRATPPQVLPQGTWMDRLGVVMPATTADQTGDVLIGLGASAGRITAIARVLDGPSDFARLRPGEVLVASITTPAWTSLFARAGAVVTDIGGPLSHSSIVAREYGIPAVLGTAVGTRRITDGQEVTVDGDAGRVYLADAGDAIAPAEHRRLNRWLITGGTIAAGAAGVAALVLRRRRAG